MRLCLVSLFNPSWSRTTSSFEKLASDAVLKKHRGEQDRRPTKDDNLGFHRKMAIQSQNNSASIVYRGHWVRSQI